MTTEHESAPATDPEGITEPDTSQATAEAAASIDESAPVAEGGVAPATPEVPIVAETEVAAANGETVASAPEEVAVGKDEAATFVPDEAAAAIEETVESPAPEPVTDPPAEAVSVIENDSPALADEAVPAADAEAEKEIFIRAERPAIVAKSVSDLPEEMLAEDFAAAIEQTVLEFKEGDIVEGTVASIDQDEVLVDIGYKSEGHIPLKELSIRHSVNPLDIVAIGDRIEALVLDKEDDEGRLILSKKRAQYERAWGRIQRVHAEGGTVTGPVIEVVKGGLIVDIGLRGFLPASLVELRRVRDLEPYVGQEIEAKVIELDRNRNNVVLSRRAYLEEQQAEERQAFLDDLAVDEIRSGVVSSVVNFGAFVDLGGMDGLVHVSELSFQHVNHPSEVVKVGDEVTVKVLEVDLDRERISLSIKQTQEDPWVMFSREHGIGDVVEGSVTKTVPFGAFVSVGDGVEGLVHVSEIAIHRVESPELELSIGQAVSVKVTEMDEERRRVSLSIKQANPEWKDREPEERAPRHKQPEVREFQREEPEEEQERTFDVDSSLEAILQELKERGIGRR
jgi:small subunit ribosomal protein S1